MTIDELIQVLTSIKNESGGSTRVCLDNFDGDSFPYLFTVKSTVGYELRDSNGMARCGFDETEAEVFAVLQGEDV